MPFHKPTPKIYNKNQLTYGGVSQGDQDCRSYELEDVRKMTNVFPFLSIILTVYTYLSSNVMQSKLFSITTSFYSSLMLKITENKNKKIEICISHSANALEKNTNLTILPLYIGKWLGKFSSLTLV